MKLAEALAERADLNRRIAQLRGRLENNALVQEGEKPAEDPAQLLTQLDVCLTRLEELLCRINRTNCETVTEGGTLTQLIAKRDVMNLHLQTLRSLVDAASRTAQRATRSEIRICSTVDVRSLQKQVDDVSAQLRRVDTALQAANWTTELL